MLSTGELPPCDCVVEATGAGVDPRLASMRGGVQLRWWVASWATWTIGVWTIGAQAARRGAVARKACVWLVCVYVCVSARVRVSGVGALYEQAGGG